MTKLGKTQPIALGGDQHVCLVFQTKTFKQRNGEQMKGESSTFAKVSA